MNFDRTPGFRSLHGLPTQLADFSRTRTLKKSGESSMVLSNLAMLLTQHFLPYSQIIGPFKCKGRELGSITPRGVVQSQCRRTCRGAYLALILLLQFLNPIKTSESLKPMLCLSVHPSLGFLNSLPTLMTQRIIDLVLHPFQALLQHPLCVFLRWPLCKRMACLSENRYLTKRFE